MLISIHSRAKKRALATAWFLHICQNWRNHLTSQQELHSASSLSTRKRKGHINNQGIIAHFLFQKVKIQVNVPRAKREQTQGARGDLGNLEIMPSSHAGLMPAWHVPCRCVVHVHGNNQQLVASTGRRCLWPLHKETEICIVWDRGRSSLKQVRAALCHSHSCTTARGTGTTASAHSSSRNGSHLREGRMWHYQCQHLSRRKADKGRASFFQNCVMLLGEGCDCARILSDNCKLASCKQGSHIHQPFGFWALARTAKPHYGGGQHLRTRGKSGGDSEKPSKGIQVEEEAYAWNLQSPVSFAFPHSALSHLQHTL